jgi:hypothetical protein
MKKLPKRYMGVVLPFFLSLLMSCIISFVSTLRGVGWDGITLPGWLGAWSLSWIVAFPVVLIVLPLVRRLSALLVETD